MLTHKIASFSSLLAVAAFLPASVALAQPHRIAGNLHPQARPEFDRGAAEGSLRLTAMSLSLRKSAAQQAALDKLLADQQDTNSPQYHRWLTPEDFAGRFGSPTDQTARLVEWLRAGGFDGVQVSRGRDYIVFNGSAAQVSRAFHSEIHRFQVEGEQHFANVSEPTLPAELAAMVASVRGLHDFHPKSPRRRAAFPAKRLNGAVPSPQFYSSSYPDTNILAPDDLATIYNINALYNAGIDGTGQTIAVIGATDIDMTDIQTFRAAFNLPVNNPRRVLVPGTDNPGIVPDALGEADLDLEWSGAIARNAKLLYVFTSDPRVATQYAIDQALAPVITYSFGECEWRSDPSDVQAFAAAAQKAAAEGITWLASSGDSGAAGCEDQNGWFTSAITRMAVNVPASIPQVTGVGGSEFNEGSGSFWANRLRSNGGSATGYIPERAWNDSDLIAQNNGGGFASTGGGSSIFFSKPAWQAGLGVPGDGARNVPDVALTASWFHDPYALITGGQFVPNGGTSAAAPAFAGIVALLNQYLVSNGVQSRPGLGNINPMLYALAQSAPSAFHDITRGSNIVACVSRSSQDCSTGTYGFNTGSGYDQATGLGSVDAFNLAHAWAAASNSPRLVITRFTASTTAKVGGSFTVSLEVTNQGQADAGAFQTRVNFSTTGDLANVSPYSLYCDAQGLTAGHTFTCSGTVTLGSSLTRGTYFLLGSIDGAGVTLASTGPVVVN